MEDDIDLSLSPVRKSAPSKGRRANSNFSSEKNSTETLENSLKSRPVSGELFLEDGPRSAGPAPPPMHGRRTGGWADENARVKTAAKTARFSTQPPEQSGGFGVHSEDDEDEDVPVIPDLDDVKDEDMALQVASAPSVAVNRVATYKELDNDLLKHVAFATLDDIDLRLLTRSLAPETALKEVDEPWHWDQVFAQVSSELRKEWFPEDDGDQDVVDQAKDESSRITRDRPYTAFNRFPV